jgi:predicted Zn-dependent peptidase
MENQVISQNSGVQGIANSLSNNYMFYRNTNLINTELENYLKVTKEDIQRVANTYLQKNNRVVMYYMPGKK